MENLTSPGHLFRCNIAKASRFPASLLALLGRFHLSHLHSPYLKGEPEQGDEAVCVMVVVQVACGEGSQGLTV